MHHKIEWWKEKIKKNEDLSQSQFRQLIVDWENDKEQTKIETNKKMIICFIIYVVTYCILLFF